MIGPNKTVRLEFRELCEHPQFRGRWVALDGVRYDAMTSKPLEGEVVDHDTDLADLCARMRAAGRSACAIVHCADAASAPLSCRLAVSTGAPPGRFQRLASARL